jgi:hypothetical protein
VSLNLGLEFEKWVAGNRRNNRRFLRQAQDRLFDFSVRKSANSRSTALRVRMTLLEVVLGGRMRHPEWCDEKTDNSNCKSRSSRVAEG